MIWWQPCSVLYIMQTEQCLLPTNFFTDCTNPIIIYQSPVVQHAHCSNSGSLQVLVPMLHRAVVRCSGRARHSHTARVLGLAVQHRASVHSSAYTATPTPPAAPAATSSASAAAAATSGSTAAKSASSGSRPPLPTDPRFQASAASSASAAAASSAASSVPPKPKSKLRRPNFVSLQQAHVRPDGADHGQAPHSLRDESFLQLLGCRVGWNRSVGRYHHCFLLTIIAAACSPLRCCPVLSFQWTATLTS